MNTLKEELASSDTISKLSDLLSTTGPCLTVYMKLIGGKQDELKWREGLRDLESAAAKFGDTGQALLRSVGMWPAILTESGDSDRLRPGTSLVIFKSPDRSHVSLLTGEVAFRADIGPHFYIRPTLAQIARNQNFYLLALSQKNTRLLQCNSHACQEVQLPPSVKSDDDAWMNQTKPDHLDRSNSTAIQGSNDEESRGEYLAHYFKQIDRGVSEVLRGHGELLVLCGVEYELPVYRRVNSYPHLASEDVRGAANSLKSGEMHARALDALERHHQAIVDQALTQWNHLAGGGASSRMKDVVTAAHDGRVLTLLISDSLEQRGSFDEATHQVRGRETGGPGDEDLVNVAAVQTILHGGNVLVTPHHKMPNGSPLAAIFRY